MPAVLGPALSVGVALVVIFLALAVARWKLELRQERRREGEE